MLDVKIPATCRCSPAPRARTVRRGQRHRRQAEVRETSPRDEVVHRADDGDPKALSSSGCAALLAEEQTHGNALELALDETRS